jgi:hypothetical protein
LSLRDSNVMSRLRKYLIIGVGLLVLLAAVQAGVSLLVRTNRMRGYLTGHLQRAFGRPVEVQRFSVQVAPIPELDAEGVTIGEDPSFGNEYFLRAEQMAAGLRWLGLLRGHFEFGTMSFTRPSLILVRNQDGHWNLERWLPPARSVAGQSSSGAASQARAESTYHLQKIDFDEGRISFKLGDEKRPFAFTNVSGSVEQISGGRWQLQLEATPWRSGVPLQSTGTLQVVGYVAGTSARLQPAQLRLHWEKVSLADLFRLMTGNDSGVRGGFALDGNASVAAGAPESAASVWRFALKTRATQIHRWDLTERDDNPRVNVNVNGLWDVAAGEARAEEVRVELPRSQCVGSAEMRTSGTTDWHARFQAMAVQGTDLLAWYRAFQPNVAEQLAMSDLITGNLSVSGWPLKWEDGAIDGSDGSLRIAGQTVAQIQPFRGVIRNARFSVDPLHFELPVEIPVKKVSSKNEQVVARAKTSSNMIDTSLTQDLSMRQGTLRLNFHMMDPAPAFKVAEAFGHSLNKGWEYKGAVNGSLAWSWDRPSRAAHKNGSLELTKAQLHIAGLNEPLRLENARLVWKDGQRTAEISKADAFGAAWSGTVSEAVTVLGEPPVWRFQLHADHLDAAELDRWIGPRARPNWLERLLPTLLLDQNTVHASELLRRVSAQGDLSADTLTVEKIKLSKAHAKITLHNLRLDAQNIEAQWGAGIVQGDLRASFSPVPNYEVNAQLQNVSMTQFPWNARWAERWSGLASGKIHLTTNGVGRAVLLKQLAGRGDLKLSKIEFRGWDVQLSAESGDPSTGASHWTTGEGEFVLSDQKVKLDGFRLDGNHQSTQLAGTISFGMDGNLTFTPSTRAPGAPSRYQARMLRVSGQLENPAVAVQPVVIEEARP